LNSGSSGAFRTDLSSGAFRTDLRHLILSELIDINPLPSGTKVDVITEYSVSLGRNLTNNEWSNLKLKEFGVPTECIEPIKAKEGFFGTFSEAKGISGLMESRGYRSVLLISSPWHTHRLKISFEKFLRNQHITMYVQKSGERDALLRDLLVEYIKLKVYQYLLVRWKS
jgi:hypothetical protein